MRWIVPLLFSTALIASGACAAPVSQGPANRPDQIPAFSGQTRVDAVNSGVAFKISQVASGLEYPWGLAFLPDGRALVTEKPGRLRVIAADGSLSAPVAGVPNVYYAGQGGLQDVLVVPGSTTRVCLSYAAKRSSGGATGLTVRCYTASASGTSIRLTNGQTVWHQLPSYAGGHGQYGGRLALAKDGTLFITAGDRQDPAVRVRAQDLTSGIGKVIRVNLDGTIPADNPFASSQNATTRAIWAQGFRNPYGAAISPKTGQLWTTENGPRGGDELNAPKAGKNYGWPVITYGEDYSGAPIGGNITQKPGLEQPVYYWDPVIAPSGTAWYTGALFPRWQGSLFIGGLASQSLTRLEIDEVRERVTGEEKFSLGHRIRDVRQAPDGSIWLLTDEANGLVLRMAPQ